MMTRTVLKLATFLSLAALTSFAVPAQAQQQQELIDRLDRVERDLNILQSQFYRSQSGGGSGTTTINSPAAGGGGGAITGDAYSQLDQRLGALEDQIRTMTGQLEKANHDNAELSAKLDRMQQDNDIRFKELEQKAGGGPPVAANAQQPPAQQAAAAEAGANPGAPQPLTKPPAPQAQASAEGKSEKTEETWNPTQGSAPHPLGQMPEADLKKLTPKNNDGGTNVQQAAAQSAPKTPQEQYDAAFALLRNNDNAGATKAFQVFLQQHPKDPLAGNADFWLGQIAFSQGKFEQAAPIFFDAYSKYPKSAKAGESLLKVGLSMSNLNKKKEACAALARFTTEFPDASEGLKRQATAEKQKLNCG